MSPCRRLRAVLQHYAGTQSQRWSCLAMTLSYGVCAGRGPPGQAAVSDTGRRSLGGVGGGGGGGGRSGCGRSAEWHPGPSNRRPGHDRRGRARSAAADPLAVPSHSWQPPGGCSCSDTISKQARVGTLQHFLCDFVQFSTRPGTNLILHVQS